MDCSVSPNVRLWLTGESGSINSSPSFSYVTSGITVVMDTKFSDLNSDGIPDLATALKSELGNFKGGLEIFRGEGDGSFSAMQYITEAGTSGSVDLGEIWALDAGDLDGDGDEDIVIGSHDNAISGHIDIYLNNGNGSFTWHSRYIAPGAVNDVKIVDMMEDDQQDLDILAATSSSQTSGYLALWLNESCTFGLPDTTGYSFAPEETPRWPDDLADAQGAALCLETIHANRDIFPDVVYGTRNSVFYSGDVFILQAYGTLPISGDKINKTSPGEVVTLDAADFNKDNRPDIAVGTRSSATQGKLIAYFGRDL